MATFLPLLLALSAPAHAGEVVDEVLSVVGAQVVTLSDLQFEQIFAAHDHSPLPVFDEAEGDLVQRLEDYRILRSLAGDVDAFRPSNDEVEARMAAFRLSWEDQDSYQRFLRRWGLDELGLREQVYARMVVERYVIRSLGLQPEPDASEVAAQTQRYTAWMRQRRAEVSIRRTEATVPP